MDAEARVQALETLVRQLQGRAVLPHLDFPTAMAAAAAPNNCLFRDAADGIIKIKDNGGVLRLLY